MGQQPLLIIGAGICGLTLAQSCRKAGVPYLIFDRESSETQRNAGWGLTVHWALPTFRASLPKDVLDRLPEAYVNKDAVDTGEKGSFTFFDLSTGEAKWQVPSAERIRVSCQRLRRVLLHKVNVLWSKTLKDIRQDAHGITALFTDGTSESGSLLIGADGAHSIVRKLCHPEAHTNWQLPVRFLDAGVRFPESAICDIRALDPFFLQGSSSKTDAYMWFSFLATPTDPNPNHPDEPASGDKDKHLCQVGLSWPYRENFLGRADPTNVPNTSTIQLSWMKSLSRDFVEPFRSIVHDMPADAEIKEIVLEDYVPRRTETFGGRVVLAGDAAHAMVMFRGEGANHAIVDVTNLLGLVGGLVLRGEDDDAVWREQTAEYDREMVERNEVAVLASRQACLDANQWERLNERSPLIRRRLMRSDLELQHDEGGQEKGPLS